MLYKALKMLIIIKDEIIVNEFNIYVHSIGILRHGNKEAKN
jgi:hypothetical protein